MLIMIEKIPIQRCSIGKSLTVVDLKNGREGEIEDLGVDNYFEELALK